MSNFISVKFWDRPRVIPTFQSPSSPPYNSTHVHHTVTEIAPTFPNSLALNFNLDESIFQFSRGIDVKRSFQTTPPHLPEKCRDWKISGYVLMAEHDCVSDVTGHSPALRLPAKRFSSHYT